MDESASVPHRISTRIGPGSVSVARTGERTYQGMNERGDVVSIGPAESPGHFTPGELLKLALAGCAAMSADRVVSRRLGDDAQVTAWAHGTSEPDNRYDRVEEELILPLGGLDEPERARLLELVARAIERSCTVARSVGDDIELDLTIVDADADADPGAAG